MSIEQIESIMTGLGFTSYEARAYTALVREHPLTGYELSKRSGIPGSKIYECIERLNRKRLIVPVGDNPARYVAVPPDELVKKLSRDFDISVKNLGELLKTDMADDSVDYIFNIYGYHEIIAKAAEMIDQAKTRIELSLWDREIETLSAEIRAAVERGVPVRLLSFNSHDINGVEVHHHRPLGESESVERWITVVADECEALTGQSSGEETSVAAWTRNRCIVFIARKYIEHEIIKIVESKHGRP